MTESPFFEIPPSSKIKKKTTLRKPALLTSSKRLNFRYMPGP